MYFKTLSEKNQIVFVKKLIYDSFSILDGICNKYIECGGCHIPKPVFRVDIGKPDHVIFALTGIRNIFIDLNAIIEMGIEYNLKLKDVKSLIITGVSHELSHLDQDVHQSMYTKLGEIQNVIRHTEILCNNYDVIEKQYGKFDPYYDRKNSVYTKNEKDVKNALKKEPKLVSSVNQRLLGFLETVFGLNINKAIEKGYKTIEFEFHGIVQHSTPILSIETIMNPKTASEKVLINEFADIVDCYASSDSYVFTNVMQNRLHKHRLSIVMINNTGFSNVYVGHRGFFTMCYYEDNDLLIR